MDYILKNEFAPVTFEIGFLAAPLDKTVKVFSGWMHKTLHRTTRTTRTGSLRQLLSSMEPLDHEGRTSLFSETRSGWVACFENGSRRPEPERSVSYLSKLLKTNAIVFKMVPDTMGDRSPGKRGIWGAYGFSLYGPSAANHLGLLRSVALSNDVDGWIFEAAGSPQPFEKLEAYKKRRKVERVDIQLLADYARAMGIELLDEKFYGPRAVSIFADLPFRSAPVAVSYREAQSSEGLLSAESRGSSGARG
jgi:hypothetical protein